MKKVRTKRDEFLVDLRVRYWIDYYNGEVDGAIEKCKGLIARCSGIEYLNSDANRDIQIFTTE